MQRYRMAKVKVPRSHISVSSICVSRGHKKVTCTSIVVPQSCSSVWAEESTHAELQNGKVLKRSVAHCLPHITGAAWRSGSIATHLPLPGNHVIGVVFP